MFLEVWREADGGAFAVLALCLPHLTCFICILFHQWPLSCLRWLLLLDAILNSVSGKHASFILSEQETQLKEAQPVGNRSSLLLQIDEAQRSLELNGLFRELKNTI